MLAILIWHSPAWPNFCCTHSTWCEIAMMAEWDWQRIQKKSEMKTRIHSVPFYPEPIHLKWSKLYPCHGLPHPSVITPVFCHRSSENPLPLLFDLFPNLHFHLTSALLPPPPLTTFCSLLSQDVKSVPFSFWFMTPVVLVCMCSVSIYPAVHVHLTSETDWYLKKGSVNSTPPLSHVFHLQDFYPFCSHFMLFCPC